MEQVREALNALEELCNSIKRFKTDYVPHAICRSPIIDHFHPDDYGQRGIAGLSKFLSRVETERDYVQGLLNTGVPPRDLTTNAVYLIAVWEEFQRCKWPVGSIAQFLDLSDGTQIKVDVVADGGNEWIKVNTIKESRLMAEFREQDSYVNSDYDTDSDTQSATSSVAAQHRGSSSSPSSSSAPKMISNSLISQAESLIRAAKLFPRPVGLPVPRIKYVLSRMEENPSGGYADPRIPQTLKALRDLGLDLIIGLQPPPILPAVQEGQLVPAGNIILDLSVIVALCCDSSHHPLPTSEEELEGRFRSLQPREGDEGNLILAEHTNVSRDLRDQLAQEVQHPLIEEIRDRLSDAAGEGSEVKWFVTAEVRDRTPGIVDLIGGPEERARARALFGGGGYDDNEGETNFWKGSRYEGRAGILDNLRVNVLEDDHQNEGDDVDGGGDDANCAHGELHRKLGGLRINHEYTTFEQRLITVCDRMLSALEGRASSPSPSPSPTSGPVLGAATHSKGKGKGKRSRNPKRLHALFPPPSRLPSAHTLRTLVQGVRGGMTILTNNRGAVGKVVREIGVPEGLPMDQKEGKEGRGKAVVWVVNPSSLSEWRRLEVEETNRKLRAESEFLTDRD